MGKAVLVVTVDVEPDWGREGWRAIEESIDFLGEELASTDSEATCFVTASLAKERPSVIRTLARFAEIASHGLTHRPFRRLPPEEVQRELSESKRLLEEEAGVVLGVRAPFFSKPVGWLGLVKGAGYRYDASDGFLLPKPIWKRRVVRDANGVAVFSVGCMMRVLPMSLFYLRLSGSLWRWLLPREPGVMFLHPHELSTVPVPFRGAKAWLLGRRSGREAREIFSRILRMYRCVSCRMFLGERSLL